VDGTELSCACIRRGVEKPNINAKLKKQIQRMFGCASLSPLEVASFFCPVTSFNSRRRSGINQALLRPEIGRRFLS